MGFLQKGVFWGEGGKGFGVCMDAEIALRCKKALMCCTGVLIVSVGFPCGIEMLPFIGLNATR